MSVTPVTLSDLYKKYVQQILNKKDFEGYIFERLLNIPEHFHGFERNPERWPEFLSWLYPRISRAIDLYRETGASFDAYISAIVQWSIREYKKREAEHAMVEYTCWRAKAEEMEVSNPEPGYAEQDYAPARVPALETMPLSPQQILILLLKTYYFVSEDFLRRVSRVIGKDPAEIQYLMDELRLRRTSREDKMRTLRESIQLQYYRVLTFEKRLSIMSADMPQYNVMQERLSRARNRFLKMKARLRRMRFNAPNSQIAEVLGIPKGTVDSCMVSLKRRFIDIGPETDRERP